MCQHPPLHSEQVAITTLPGAAAAAVAAQRRIAIYADQTDAFKKLRNTTPATTIFGLVKVWHVSRYMD